ncbi:MAG: dTMP kinase [Candidatus Lightella neohaematopini]|nr:dTMP kinase [Candidatus Lightella neohaematopini]
MSIYNGKFIVVEGLDGSGKTSAAKQILKILRYYGIVNVNIVRDPGGTPLSEILRLLITGKFDYNIDEPTNYAELFMLYAARVQLIEKFIKPKLKKNYWIISDRYYLSSYAYQSGGRCINNQILKFLDNIILHGVYPDLTIFLDVLPKIGLNRIKNNNTKLDRIENESLNFFYRVYNYYKKLVKFNKNIICINANQSLSIVNQEINYYMSKWLTKIM